MSEKTFSRRDVVKMAKAGGMVVAGLGLSQFALATDGSEAVDNGDGTWTVSQATANRLHELGIKNGGYGVIIFKLSDVIVSSSHALPLSGDMAAAKSDQSAQISVKVSGKRLKPGPQASGRLGNFEIQM